MAKGAYMAKATIIYQLKVYLEHRSLVDEALVEIKIWRVPDDQRFPEKIKYSLYCVRNSEVIVGFDNHHPKGHHLHVSGSELQNTFVDSEKLIEDFFSEIAKQGYEL